LPSHHAIRQHQHQQQPTAGGATSSVHAGASANVHDERGLQYLIGAYWSYDELRKRPTELSIEGRFGEAAVPLLDDDVRRLASDWLGAHDDVDLA
jgi:hypothetical protein